MKRLLRALLAALVLSTGGALWAPRPALAHPLGNFTINQYARVRVGSNLQVFYVLDYAEIPAFQEKQRLQADPTYLDSLVGQLTGGLSLEVDGRALPLHLSSRAAQFLPGQGGLETLRLELTYTAAPLDGADTRAASFRDDNYPGRLGWREIVVQAAPGARIVDSTVAATSRSDELRAYPTDLLASPLDQSEASFHFSPGGGAFEDGPTTILGRVSTTARSVQDNFAALIESGDSSPSFLLFALAAAVALGALHALEPGHGKAVMAGFLVGTRGTWRQATILGLTITASHTAGVFALGLVTLFAASVITPERLYPWLTLASGVLVLGMGARLAAARLRSGLVPAAASADPDHAHPHRHGLPFFGHVHSHPVWDEGDIAPSGRPGEFVHHGADCHSEPQRGISGPVPQEQPARRFLAAARNDKVEEADTLPHCHDHHHKHDPHSHVHPHAHQHHPPPAEQSRSPVGRAGLIALGISGGLVPCPSALVVLLAAISLHRVAFGLLLIVAFSLGLALVLTSIGLALASGAPLLRRLPRTALVASAGRAARFLPVVSALVVVAAGLGLTLQALPGVMR